MSIDLQTRKPDKHLTSAIANYKEHHRLRTDDVTHVLQQSDTTLEDTCVYCIGNRGSPPRRAIYDILLPCSGGWVAEELPPEDTAVSCKQPDIPDERSVHGATVFQQMTTQQRRPSRLATTEAAAQLSPPMSDSASADQQGPSQSLPRPAFKRRMDDALPSGGANTAPVGNQGTAAGEEPTVKGGQMAFDLLQAAMHLANQPPQRRKKSTSLKKVKSDSKLTSKGSLLVKEAATPQHAPNSAVPGTAAANGTVLASAIAQVESLQQHNLQLLMLNRDLERELDNTKRMMFLQHQELTALRVQVGNLLDGGLAVPVAPRLDEI